MPRPDMETEVKPLSVVGGAEMCRMNTVLRMEKDLHSLAVGCCGIDLVDVGARVFVFDGA